MRRFTTGLWVLPVALFLLTSPREAFGARRTREPVTALQPTDSSTRLVLLSRPGWARVESDRGRSRVKLRDEETLTGITETVSGWVATGVRDNKDGSSLVFVTSEAGKAGAAARLPTLEQRGALQLRPVLLVHDGRLAGAAWLEGDSQRKLTVRFAEWHGISWGPSEIISGPGPGSQTGLSGTTLQSGEVLLAWSRFDGSDDEIYWSRRRGARWSSPARIGANNRTPDITPALARSGRGAVLVWGRMEQGQYRLLSSRFRGGEWRSERILGAPGSVFPSLVRSDYRLLVVYRMARPRGWAVAEFDGASPFVRRARIEDGLDSTSRRRPVVTGIAPTGPVLRWLRPGRSHTPRWDVQ